MPRQTILAATLCPFLLWSAGCTAPGEGTNGRDLQAVDAALGSIEGHVVDLEIVPLEGADVVLLDNDMVNVTDTAGGFVFRNLEPGEYAVSVARRGYAPATAHASVLAGEVSRLTVTLTPTASDVPYHESRVFVALLDCSWAIASATFPCVPLDRVTGQNITGDQSAWSFQIPAPGLANVLHEMTWVSQPTGREMKVVITEPNQPVFVGGVSNFYMLHSGPSPLRTWLIPGTVAVGGTIPFNGNESTPFSAYIRGSERNNTVPFAAIYIDQKADNWFTFFYNRPGPDEYTALPDA